MGRSPEILIVIDQGTSATRALAFDTTGRIVSFHTYSLHTHRPRPGHAEMNPAHILASVDAVLQKLLHDVTSLQFHPVALGISVQRASFLLWEAHRGKPLSSVLTWQDTRAAQDLHRFRDHTELIAHTTGVPLGPYYGAPKFAHLVANDQQIQRSLRTEKIHFIPVESLLIHQLTGNLLVDETIAGRTLVFDIHHRCWSDELLALFGLPRKALPELVPSRSTYGQVRWEGGSIPLMVCMGDQQAAMTGLGARQNGDAAINLGTSGSVALHTGDRPRPSPGLLANVAFSTPGRAEYLLEGTINAVGALFTWFAQELDRPEIASRWPQLAATCTDLVMVPGVNGLAAPYWISDVPTTFEPHQAGYSVAEQLRAGMESIAFLISDITRAMDPGTGRSAWGDIHVGGGMAQKPLLQFIADVLQHPLNLHRVREATARGVAIRLAEALGWETFANHTQPVYQRFSPKISPARQAAQLVRWREVISKLAS